MPAYMGLHKRSGQLRCSTVIGTPPSGCEGKMLARHLISYGRCRCILKCCSSVASTTRDSINEKCWPMQTRGPWPKGTNMNLHTPTPPSSACNTHQPSLPRTRSHVMLRPDSIIMRSHAHITTTAFQTACNHEPLGPDAPPFTAPCILCSE